MDKLDELLKYIQRTNPTMTMDRLIEELLVSRYSTFGLVMTMENCMKKAC